MESHPPDARPPIIFHTTSGTTGKPQPLLFGPRGREVQNRLLARMYLFQGMRDDDVVHSVYGHGLINGGHYVREAVSHWTRALFISAGTGVETRSVDPGHHDARIRRDGDRRVRRLRQASGRLARDERRST